MSREAGIAGGKRIRGKVVDRSRVKKEKKEKGKMVPAGFSKSESTKRAFSSLCPTEYSSRLWPLQLML